MPEFSEENGLLPGRGPAGRAGLPVDGRAGAALAAGANGSADGAAGAADSDGAAATAGADGATAAGTGATGSATTTAGASAASAAGADFLAGALGVGGAGAAAGAGKISRSLRTTGGSTVDDADRTNSPSSVSLVMTTLLSIPSSFASS